jgi:hypothetical protein
MTIASGLGVTWRDAYYAFVVDDAERNTEEPPIIEVAIADAAGPLFHSRMDVRDDQRGWAGSPSTATIRDLSPMVERAVRGRVVVTHGPNVGWRLLAVLDSLGLARALLPSRPCGTQELAERFDVQLPSGAAAEPAVLRDARLLARVFERMDPLGCHNRIDRSIDEGQLAAVIDPSASPEA